MYLTTEKNFILKMSVLHRLDWIKSYPSVNHACISLRFCVVIKCCAISNIMLFWQHSLCFLSTRIKQWLFDWYIILWLLLFHNFLVNTLCSSWRRLNSYFALMFNEILDTSLLRQHINEHWELLLVCKYVNT